MLKKRIYYFYEEAQINDATSYYLNLIKEAAQLSGLEFVQEKTLDKVIKTDVILTITTTFYLHAKVKKPFNRTIFWAQGVEPDEAIMRGLNPRKIFFKRIVEAIAIKTSSLLIMVSKAQKDHYRKCYLFKGKNYFIMPCYNISRRESHNFEKYKTPSFVYAGGLAKWQCIDDMLETFKLISQALPNATLKVFTGNTEEMNELFRVHGVNNASCEYVKLEDLQQRLSDYKYGFLLREENIVNHVATPTKMNSYLSAGLIPIFTTAVDAFKEYINLGNYSLIFETPIDPIKIAKKIVKFENMPIDVDEINNNIDRIFNKYYNDQCYLKPLSTQLKNYVMSSHG